MQNIPNRGTDAKKFRECFVASEGHKIISADYSQQELRVMTELSRDPKLVYSYENDLDIHITTAANLSNKSYEDVEPDMRRIAKDFNYGASYGSSAWNLANKLELPIKEVEAHLKNYWESYSGLRKWTRRMGLLAWTRGYSETIWGRRRWYDTENMRKDEVLRQGTNHVIQGSSADMLKLGLVYTEAANLLKTDVQLDKEIDTWLVEVSQNRDLFTIMRKMAEKCVEYNLETTWRTGITYDLLIWESDISNSGLWESTLKTLEENEHFGWETTGEYQGCFMAYLSHLAEFAGERSADKVLVRSNKVQTYTGNDLALQMWKFGLMDQIKLSYQLWTVQFDDKAMWSSTPFQSSKQIQNQLAPPTFAHAEKVVNVIGSEQDYPQQILKVTMKLLGHPEKYENSIHLSYKHVTLPGERISGREDEWIKTRAWADAVIDDAVARAYDYLIEKRPDLSEPQKREIAEKIGIATVRYWLLKFSTDQEIVFQIDRASSLEGDSGPYVLYSYVRASKILVKAEERDHTPRLPETYASLEKDEIELIKSLAQFPEIIQSVAKSLKPNLLTTYANELAMKFNKFYEKFPVLSAENELLLQLRLAIVGAYKMVLQNVLGLLGLSTLDEM